MQEELLKLWLQTGKTVFLITHSAEEAIFLGTTVAVMSSHPGRIIRQFDATFGSSSAHRDTRAIKSDTAFVALREEVLEAVLTEQQ